MRTKIVSPPRHRIIARRLVHSNATQELRKLCDNYEQYRYYGVLVKVNLFELACDGEGHIEPPRISQCPELKLRKTCTIIDTRVNCQQMRRGYWEGILLGECSNRPETGMYSCKPTGSNNVCTYFFPTQSWSKFKSCINL